MQDGSCGVRSGKAENGADKVVQTQGGDALANGLRAGLGNTEPTYFHAGTGEADSPRRFVMLCEKRSDALKNQDIRAVWKHQNVANDLALDAERKKRAEIIPVRERRRALGRGAADKTQRVFLLRRRKILWALHVVR